MELKVHGCRGSIPVQSNNHTSFGGNTSCFEVSFDKFQLFFDTGSGFRTAKLASKDYFKIILYSHWHHDHIQGLPFNPQLFLEDNEITICSALSSRNETTQTLKNYFSGAYFPVDLISLLKNIKIQSFCDLKWLDDSGLKLEYFSLIHPGGAVGYKLEFKGKSITYLCDNEYDESQFYDLNNFVCGSNIVIWDGMFTEEELQKKNGWGHSSINQGIEFFKNSTIDKLLISHHAPERTDYDLNQISAELPDGIELAFDGMVIEI